MDSSAVCASCLVPTADKSSKSAAGSLRPHHTATLYLTRYIVLPDLPIPKDTD